MRRAVLLLCLLGAAGIWGWALFAPKKAKLEPLPARFVGTFRFFEFLPSAAQSDNPLPEGFVQLFTFREDGTYVLSVLVSGGYEAVREEGVVAAGGTGVLTMTRISRNRKEDRAPAQSFKAEWGKDAQGPVLALRHAQKGYTWRMRPEKAE